MSRGVKSELSLKKRFFNVWTKSWLCLGEDLLCLARR